MPETSAGILLYRLSGGGVEFLLLHPGGPFWKNRDDGVWTIPKGSFGPDETPEAAARREFAEETGMQPVGELAPLGVFRQPSGKLVTAFALAGDFDTAGLKSNYFTLEWPPKSGGYMRFREADRAGWFAPEAAFVKILKGQAPILRTLMERLDLAAG